MSWPCISWGTALFFILQRGKPVYSGAKCCLPRSLVHFQPSLRFFIYAFFIPVTFGFHSLPHLSWCRSLDKLESCVIHCKDCLHWNILVLRRTYVHRFWVYINTWFHQEQESVICSKLLIMAVFHVIILLLNLQALISKDLLIMKIVLCQGNQLWCTVRNKKVFNREEL